MNLKRALSSLGCSQFPRVSILLIRHPCSNAREELLGFEKTLEHLLAEISNAREAETRLREDSLIAWSAGVADE
jgi:hypothetical protein